MLMLVLVVGLVLGVVFTSAYLDGDLQQIRFAVRDLYESSKIK